MRVSCALVNSATQWWRHFESLIKMSGSTRNDFDVAVVGATGLVGETMLSILEDRSFPVANLYPIASSRSAGKRIQFRGKQLKVLDLESFDFSKVQ